MALLRAEGFSEIRLMHGASEFGKDVIAKRDGKQWAFQSKAGNVKLADWRRLTGQLNELRTNNYSGPEFDSSLPREAVLVVTGRLVGQVPLAASDYNRQALERGEPHIEIWNRDELLSRLSGNPDAVLRGSVDGGLMTMLGSIDEGDVSMDSVERFSRRWDDFSAGQLASRGVIEASIVCSRFQQVSRLDLACHLAVCLVRAAWANDQATPDEALLAADAAGELFESFATEIWELCDEHLLRKRGVVSHFGSGAWAAYPVFCARLAEIIGLLALRTALRADPVALIQAEWLARFVYTQPGVTHFIGDRFAVSLVPPVLLLQKTKPRAAKKLLIKSTVWLCDRYEAQRGDGLSSWTDSPGDEVDRVFGGALEHIRLRGRRTQSHVASVLLDLAAVSNFKAEYADIRNDQMAVKIVPVVLRCPDEPDQFRLSGEANRWELNPQYPDELPPKGQGLDIAHHREAQSPRRLVAEGRTWDVLCVSSALRDRHFLDAIYVIKQRLDAAMV